MAEQSPLPSPVSSRSSSFSSYRATQSRSRRRRLLSLKRIDRLICSLFRYFPLLLVYGGTTWAAYTAGWSICFVHTGGTRGYASGILVMALYAMANWSYTTAVFRDPGSPIDSKHAYSHLPTSEGAAGALSSITVKSDGQERFCKKCHFRKPDRAHHCSTCGRCILKMDHHCPWLATCLGLYNYKPFLLFLIYTSLLCIISFLIAAFHVYKTIFDKDEMPSFEGDTDLTSVNWVLMATVSGIVGLVLSGFTIWHLMLVASGMTTIESMEKVRYSTPGLHFRANGAFAFPPRHHMGGGPNDWGQMEGRRAYDSYNAYLEEEANSKLPHAFDLGRRRNFLDVFGRRPFSWFLPLPMTQEEESITNGWSWETSRTWRHGVERIRKDREERLAQQLQREREQLANSWGISSDGTVNGAANGNPNSNFNTVNIPSGGPPGSQLGASPVTFVNGVPRFNRGAGVSPFARQKLVARDAKADRDEGWRPEDFAGPPSHSPSDESEDEGDEDSVDGLSTSRRSRKDYYHRELYRSSASSSPASGNGFLLAPAKMENDQGSRGSGSRSPLRKNYGNSKADQILGRSRYDADEEGEVVRLKRISPQVQGQGQGQGQRRESLIALPVRGATTIQPAPATMVAPMVQTGRLGDDWSRWGDVGDLVDDDDEDDEDGEEMVEQEVQGSGINLGGKMVRQKEASSDEGDDSSSSEYD